MINSNSSKEDVANYFEKNCKIKEDVKKNMIKEDISGDILFDLDDNDFKALGIKVGPLAKIKKFLKENKDKFEEKQINEKITAKSNPTEVAEFFKKCLNFNGELNNLNGKGLIELNEEGINKLGLNIGQKKKLIKYINYFKTLKIDETEDTNEIIFTKESTEEEITKYLKEKLNFRDSAIESLGLDGDSLFTIEEKDIDELEELNQEEKNNLKQLIKKLKEKSLGQETKQETKEEKPLLLRRESSEIEVGKYLKEKLKINDKGIESLALDGERLFELEEMDIDRTEELNEEEKDNLKKLIKDLKENNEEPEIKISKESSEEEVAKFLKEKLKINVKGIESLALDGESLFTLDEMDISLKNSIFISNL